ncbi:MAG: hypothetical protein LBN05_07225 [Oscillospiraceae bacterium]|jgi:hypothetical protein|nr:hypothetical protein [Oscillospiraceae bacterium]
MHKRIKEAVQCLPTVLLPVCVGALTWGNILWIREAIAPLISLRILSVLAQASFVAGALFALRHYPGVRVVPRWKWPGELSDALVFFWMKAVCAGTVLAFAYLLWSTVVSLL